MKLRLRGDSIRLRLTQSEVRSIGDGTPVEETTSFAAGQAFTYALTHGHKVGATFTGGRLEVSVPAEIARRWATSDEIGIEGEQDAGDGRVLRIMVEKDFACLKPREGEDQGDAFPHPDPKAC
jgi:hypothetical protein